MSDHAPLRNYRLGHALQNLLQESPHRHYVGFSGRVAELIEFFLLRNCPVDLDFISRQFQLSCRQLERRIHHEANDFNVLLDQVMRYCAMRQVALSQKPLHGIYADLGYTDGEAFSEAFKSWTGLNPEAFRRMFGQASNQHAWPNRLPDASRNANVSPRIPHHDT